MERSRSLVVPAVLDSLPEALELVARTTARAGLSQRRADHVTLAVEEAFVNVCRYAYSGGVGEVEVRTRTADGEVVVEIVDDGEPFDPLESATPNPDASLDDRRAGGMGILLLRSVTDGLRYRREDDRNVLEIVVRDAVE